jgi:hypothetical protein
MEEHNPLSLTATEDLWHYLAMMYLLDSSVEQMASY